MLRRITATLIAATFILAAGCAKESAEQAAPASGTPPPSQVTATVPQPPGGAPVDQSNRKLNMTVPLSSAFYESADVGRSVKADGTIDAATDKFVSSDRLYVSVKAREVPKGLASNMTILGPDKKPVSNTRAEFTPATKRAVFAINDLKAWRPGSYDVEVTMDGDVVFERVITVTGGPEQPKAR